MANESGDRRAFVLAALKGKSKAKKPSAEGPLSSTLKKASGKPMNKKQKLAAKKARAVTEEEVDESDTGVKRLRQDALQWKLLSAQPEDFADFDDDIDVASDGDDQEAKKGTRKAKPDPMANLFDNEGGMMMLEEVDGVDVMWEEDGKGGKKAILIVRIDRQLFFQCPSCLTVSNRKPRKKDQSSRHPRPRRRLSPHQAMSSTESPKIRNASEQIQKARPWQKRPRRTMA